MPKMVMKFNTTEFEQYDWIHIYDIYFPYYKYKHIYILQKNIIYKIYLIRIVI